MLHHKGQIRNPGLRFLYGGMGGVPFLRHGGQFTFQFFITINAMLRQEVHGLGGLFQIVQLRPMRKPGVLLGLNIVLDINEQADLPVTLFRLLGRSGASGDPGGDGFLRVVATQGFHSGKPFLIRSATGHIFSSFYLIALLLQAAEQIFKICGGRYEPVNGRFQLRRVAGSGLGRHMLNIALAFVLPGDHHGQTVFLTESVAGAAYLMVASLVGVVMPVIRKADRIENHMVMDVILVYVGGQYKFILTAQYLLRKLHTNLMGFLRRDLTGFKGLYQVAAQVRPLVDGVAAGPGKFNIRCFGGAAIGGYQQFPVCLFGIADIVDGRL